MRADIEKNEVPENWKQVTLGNVVNIVYGKNLPTKDLKEDGYPVYGANGIIGKYEKYLYEDAQVLISCRGAYSGKANMSPPCSYITNNSLVLEIPESSTLLKKYLYYWLNIADKTTLVTGSAQPQVTINNAIGLKVPLAPPKQQKQIVAKIEQLFSHIDAGVEALNIAKQRLKQYRQSVLKAAVTGELTKEWREAQQNAIGCAEARSASIPYAQDALPIVSTSYETADKLLERILQTRRQKWEEQQQVQFKAKGKHPKNDKWKEKYKELSIISNDELNDLPELPDDWVYTRLGNVIEEPKYGTSKKCTYDCSGTGVLRIPNVADSVIDSEDLKYAVFDETEKGTYQLSKGDILIIRSNGSIKIVGKCALIDAKDLGYLYAGYLIRLKPSSELVTGGYLVNCLRSIYLRNQIEFKAKSTSGVNNINSGEIQSLIVAICSKEEQLKIKEQVEDKLEDIKRLNNEIETQLEKAQKTKQSILAAAFSGKLS